MPADDSTLVTRARTAAASLNHIRPSLVTELADRVEALEAAVTAARVERDIYRVALEPVAQELRDWPKSESGIYLTSAEAAAVLEAVVEDQP